MRPTDIVFTRSPRFCFIAPTAYLDRYATQSTAHLVLAHLVDQDPLRYGQFYQQRRTCGDLVICDNGAFELGRSYDPDKLIQLGKACGADILVLPDYPGEDATKTIQAAGQYIPIFKKAGFRTMFVPQSVRGDVEQWISAYEWAARNQNVDAIGMSILGIPAALPHIPASYARVVMTQLLEDRKLLNRAKHHHYLGLNAGPNLEIPSLISMGILDTIDSSGPIWQGILGVEYTRNADSFSSVKKIHKPVDFDTPLYSDMDTHRRIQHNIDLTLSLFGEGRTTV